MCMWRGSVSRPFPEGLSWTSHCSVTRSTRVRPPAAAVIGPSVGVIGLLVRHVPRQPWIGPDLYALQGPFRTLQTTLEGISLDFCCDISGTWTPLLLIPRQPRPSLSSFLRAFSSTQNLNPSWQLTCSNFWTRNGGVAWSWATTGAEAEWSSLASNIPPKITLHIWHESSILWPAFAV